MTYRVSSLVHRHLDDVFRLQADVEQRLAGAELTVEQLRVLQRQASELTAYEKVIADFIIAGAAAVDARPV